MLARLLIDKFTAPDEATISFLVSRCLRSRFNKNDCRICLDECEANALVLKGRLVAFDNEKCSGCMRCTASCPNDAFSSRVELLPLLENLHHSNEVNTLICEKNYHIHQEITVPCLGCLSEQVLAVINSVAKKEIILDLSQCSGCSNEHIVPTLQIKIQRLTTKLLQNKNMPLKFILRDIPIQSEDNKTDRRSYLRLARRSFANLRKDTSHKKPSNCSSSNHAGKQPVMNSVALMYGYTHSSPDAGQILHSYFHTVRATDGCDLCPACRAMCPTRALKRKVIDGEKRLLFTSSICSGCGLCQQFCRKQAISITEGCEEDPMQPVLIR